MHMIEGLGQVIRYMTLIAEPIRLTKELLNIYRGLEVSRTILYGTDTMLALGQDLGRSDASDCPKLVMSQELMLEASLLSHRYGHRWTSNTSPESPTLLTSVPSQNVQGVIDLHPWQFNRHCVGLPRG